MSLQSVRAETLVQAPLDRMWALSTRVELVQQILGMRAVAGQTTGFVQAGSRVTWKGWKFGLRTEHHTLITGFCPPQTATVSSGPELHAEAAGQLVAWFQDRQEKGRFAFFQHNHWLRERVNGEGVRLTVLEDEVLFTLPFGQFGLLAAKALLKPYVETLVQRRFASLKTLAEGDGWRSWIDSGTMP